MCTQDATSTELRHLPGGWKEERGVPEPERKGMGTIGQSSGMRISGVPQPVASAFQAAVVTRTVTTVSTTKVNNTDNKQ